MVLSLVPMSAFAASATVPNGSFSIDDTATDADDNARETVTVKLTQAEGTTIGTTPAQAKLTLNKGEFVDNSTLEVTAKYDGAAAGTEAVVVGSLNVIADDIAYLTLENKAAPLDKIVGSKLTDDLYIYVTFEILCEEEDAGDVTLSVDELNDSNLEVSKSILIGVIEEATDSDMKMTVKDDTTKIGYDGGELSRVTLSDIDEAGAVETLDLELPDYITWNDGQTVLVGSKTVDAADIELNDDENIMTVTVAGDDVVGTYDISQDLIVTPNVDVVRRDASTGEISLKVTARNASGSKLDSVDEVVGSLVGYDVTMSAVEKNKKVIPAIYGGDDTTVKVTIEGVDGSFTTDREIDFTLEGADIAAASDIDAIKGLSVSSTKDYDDGEFSMKVLSSATDELTFYLTIEADYTQDGTVVLTAESRDFGTIEADIATVTPAYTVSVEKVTQIKKGEALATADIVIKEAKAGMFDTDQYLVLNLNDKNRNTMSFASDYKMEMTNGLDADDDLFDEDGNSKSDLNNLVLEITSSSTKEAGMITISNVLVSVDGAAVDGIKTLDTYLVADQAANTADDTIEVKDDATAVEYALSSEADLDADYAIDYVNVVKEYGTVATTTVFKIGSKEYTVNGETMTANEAPFIAGKGYTMLPVRALAESLGLTADWNSNTKTATFSSASKIASVVIGSDMIYVNGTPITLNAKAEIKNGSTFVELRSLASAFGVEIQWDATTKMVTVIG